MFDLRHFTTNVEAALANHNLGLPGAYQHTSKSQETGISPSASASAALILHALNRIPDDLAEQRTWIGTLQGLQNPETGLFEEAGHPTTALTGQMVAALNLFHARPLRPLKGLAQYKRLHALVEFLDTLDWRSNPAGDARRGTGIYTALVLSGEASLEWEDRYFSWLWEESDSETGLWRKARIAPVTEEPYNSAPSMIPHLVGSFYYLSTLECARQPLRYPEQLVDTCLELFASGETRLGEQISQTELAWVTCLNQAAHQSGHRFADARAALEQFTSRYFDFLIEVDPEKDPDFNNLSLLSACVRCLAELQQALPGLIRTVKPLRSNA